MSNPWTVYVQAQPLPSAAELRWPTKTPGETVFCTLDASGWLNPGDQVLANSIAITAQPNDLAGVLVADSCTGTAFQVQLSGGSLPAAGTPPTDYACTISFTTQLGAVFDEVVWLRVAPKSPNASIGGVPVAVVQGETGRGIESIMLSQSGQEITFQFALSDGTVQTQTVTGPGGIYCGSSLVTAFGTTSFQTDANGVLSAQPPITDNLTIGLTPANALQVLTTPAVSLTNIGTLQSTDTFAVVRPSSGQVYLATQAQIEAADIAALAPQIFITPIQGQPSGQPFTVTGTLQGYNFVPVLLYEDGTGGFQPLPAGSVVTTTSFSFTHPGLPPETTSITVADANGVQGVSNNFAISSTIPTSGTITGIPTGTIQHGTSITVTIGLQPANAVGYVVANEGGLGEEPRIQVVNGSVVSVALPNAGATNIAINTAATGANQIYHSPVFTVS